MLKKIKRIISENGFWGGTKYVIDKLTGRAALMESVDNLYYFLNRYMDIRNFPKAEGEFRILQECDVELLRIFHNVCEKNGLTYWIDFGTLLGAERHGGFIPWDDDMDVTMPREDYNKALKIIPEEMAKIGIEVGEFSFRPMAYFGFSFRHKETGIWLDVFPADQCYIEGNVDNNYRELQKRVKKYQHYYKNHFNKVTQDVLAHKKKTLITEFYSQSDTRNNAIFIHEPEFCDPQLLVSEVDEVFPLKKMMFEGYEFYAPNMTQKYLTRMYGKGYMGFPKSGIEHHGGQDGKLYEWACVHNIDMKTIKNTLHDIANN